jgi:hypothetical protein
MLQPHAYIPLDPRFLSKKNQENAISQFGSVVRGGRKQETNQRTKRSRHGQIISSGNRNQRKAKAAHRNFSLK